MDTILRTSRTLKVRFITLSCTHSKNPGTMPPKNVSSFKQVVKKDAKQALMTSTKFSDFKYEILSESSGEVYDRTFKKKVAQRGKVIANDKGKKVVPQDSESPPKGPQKKNPTTSPPYTPQPPSDDDNADDNNNNDNESDSSLEEICVAVGVLELHGRDEMIKARRTFDIGMIIDVSNPLARPMIQVVDIIVGLFPHDYQTDIPATTAATEVESQTKGTPTNAASTSSALPPVQSLRRGQTYNVTESKIEVAEIKKMVLELYKRLVVVELVVETMIPTIHMPNIWVDLVDALVVDSRVQRHERMRKGKKIEKDKKRDHVESIQDKRDHEIRVHKMAMGAGGLRALFIDTAGVDVVPPSTIDSVPIDVMIDDESRTWSVGPHADIVKPMP
ncbi:hypothetical protein FXO38_10547 [Capsicum annuum]|nr:hypothetical protein FXO38_10547 [Capsicum annuum]